MKKAIALFLAVLMMLAAAGCSSSAPVQNQEPAASAAPAAAETAADPYADMEPVTFNIATSYKEGSDYINTLHPRQCS